MRTPLPALAVVPVVAAACLAPAASTPFARAVRLVQVATPTGDLDHLPRVPQLRLRFDRALAPPAPDAVLLVSGELSDTLLADAARATPPATLTARVLTATVDRDPADPTVIRVRASAALLPDTRLALVVTTRLRATDGGLLETADAGAHALGVPLTVAPARLCGALATLETVGEALPRVAGRIHVRFDRPVRLPAPAAPFALLSAEALPVPSDAGLDCLDAEGWARCGWIEPARVLGPTATYHVTLGPLVSRNGARAESAAMTFPVRDVTPAPVAFGPRPVCTPGEDPDGAFCLRLGDRWIELRASTTGTAMVRAVAAGDGAESAALGAPGTLHTLRIPVASPGAMYTVTAWAWGADGTAHDVLAAAPVVTSADLPRVRITEVVARPHGGSGQGYVEVLNDGDAPAALAGYVLQAGTGRSVLPADAVVAPHARALVVTSTYDPRGLPAMGDPPVAAGTALIVVHGSHVGHLLRTTAEDLALADPVGRVLSFVPGADPARAPRTGVGLVRADLDLADEDPAAWSYDAAGGCTPGAPDRLR